MVYERETTAMKMLTSQTLGSSILAIIQIDDGFIVHESYIRTHCNLYKVDKNFEFLWEPTVKGMPLDGNFLIRSLRLDKLGASSVVKIYDGYGEATLNTDTGDLTHWSVLR